MEKSKGCMTDDFRRWIRFAYALSVVVAPIKASDLT
jgi:hypothetical protein